jgi:hypothetical protein
MKFFTLLVCFSLILSSCKGQEHQYKLEDDLYNCIIKSNKAKGVNIEEKMDSLHSSLIKNKVLKDYSGESIIALIEQMSDGENLPTIQYQPNINIIDISLSNNIIDKFCKNLDIKLLEDSSTKIYKIGEDLRKLKDISLSNVSNVALKTLTAKDFEHPFYKTFFLTSLTVLVNREIHLQKKSEAEPKD